MRGTRLGVGGLVAVVGVVALAAALMNAGRISDELDDRWETFNSSEERVEPTGARVAASFPDQRSDYWNVALDLFREQPVAGVGAGSYGVRYNAERKYSKPSRYTHDIWLRTLAEGGIVAFGLLLAYLAAAFGGILAARRGASSAGKAVGAACFAAGAYFFVHASFDWLEEFPALASPAFALPLIGIAAIAGAASPGGAAGRSALVGWALGGIAAALALVSLLVPYLSLRYFERGVDTGTANARSAFDDLDRAAELNPLDPEPHLRAGTIAIAVGDEARARREFEKGLDVQANSYSHLELGLLDAQIGRFRSAERHLARAGALDRNDRVVAAARVRVSRRERVDPGAFNRGIRSITRERFTRPVK